MTAHIEEAVPGDAAQEPLPAEPAAHPRPSAAEALDLRRPTLSGDLREMLPHAPVFRRNVAGYDRFQVDTYVHWAEDELASAGRMRDEMLSRLVRLRAELDDTRRQLSQSPGVREALRLVPRIGWVLAEAADQADELRAEADAERASAAAEAQRVVAEATTEAERILAEARAEAGRVVAEARTEAERLAAASAALVADAERAADEARAEAGRRAEEAVAVRRRAAEDAERTRQAAARDADHARAQAREDVLRLMTAGREQRRRVDAETTAARDALDRAAAQQVAALRAEVEQLEARLTEVGEQLHPVAAPLPAVAGPDLPVPRRPRHASAPLTGARRTAALLHLPRRRHP